MYYLFANFSVLFIRKFLQQICPAVFFDEWFSFTSDIHYMVSVRSSDSEKLRY